jgi:hypothetical protein
MNTKKSPDYQLDLFERDPKKGDPERDEPFSETSPSEVPSSGRYRRYSDVREIDLAHREWNLCESEVPFCNIDEVSADIFKKIEHQLTLSDDPVFQIDLPADLQGLITMLWQVRHQQAKRVLSNSFYSRRKQDPRIFYRVYRAFHRSYCSAKVRKPMGKEELKIDIKKYRYLLKMLVKWLLSREFDIYNSETGLIEHHWRVFDCTVLELQKVYPKLTISRTEKGGERKKVVDLIDIFLQLSF